jgi:hypothetical protein
MNDDLADLVDNPRETLDVEVKGWLDLDDLLARANVARHISALANYGGGYLVFGFSDDLKRDENRPHSLERFNRDVFSSIVKKYLTPTLQCEVTVVTASDGANFPVVRVPSHGTIPICARADGPSNEKGRPQGIQKGIHYVRKDGPESAPIASPEDWAAVIRRCLVKDRERLLSDIAGLVVPVSSKSPSTAEQTATWHRDGERRFLEVLSQTQGFHWQVPLERNRSQLSYLIAADKSDVLDTGRLQQVLDDVNREVRSTVSTGWSMFYPFTRPEISPTIRPEFGDGTGPDVMETTLIAARDFDTSLPDFWRVSPDGRATIFRAYREDRRRTSGSVLPKAGTWLSPITVLRETAEIAAHARAMLPYFPTATHVQFRCTWAGLMDRELQDFNPEIYWGHGKICRTDTRTVEGEWTPAQLTASLWVVVAELACPVLRLFGFSDCSPAFVQKVAHRFITYRGP